MNGLIENVAKLPAEKQVNKRIKIDRINDNGNMVERRIKKRITTVKTVNKILQSVATVEKDGRGRGSSGQSGGRSSGG